MNKLLCFIVVAIISIALPQKIYGVQSKLFAMVSERAEETPVESPDESIDALEDVPEEEDVDVSSFFRALFDDDSDDDTEEDESERESRDLDVDLTKIAESEDNSETSEEDRAVTDDATIGKTNKFVDALLRKANVELKKGGDPLNARLNKPKKGGSKKRNKGSKKGNKGSKNGNTGSKKGNKGSKNETQGSKNKAKGNGNEQNSNKKNKKSKRQFNPEQRSDRSNTRRNGGGRHPRVLDLDTEVENHEESKTAESVSIVEEASETNVEVHARSKREIDVELVETSDDTDEEEQEEEEEDDENDVETPVKEVSSRQSKDMNFFENSGIGMGARRAQNKKMSAAVLKVRKNGKGNKKSKNKNTNNKKKDGKKNNKSKKSKKGGKKKPTTHAIITGFSTLERKGEVSITQSSKRQRIQADITLGPVSVEISRKFGGGDTRTARSFSPSLTGKIIIEVSKNGNAKITKMKISPPKNVRTTGSLVKQSSKKKFVVKSERYMKTSIKRVTPKLSKKIKNAAQRVLTTTSGVIRRRNN